MKVMKKNNREEIFEIGKLERSIKNSANDINITLNNSDVRVLSNEILREITILNKENELTSSYEIMGVTISVLKKNSFAQIIPSYLRL